jgi:hypothetical protein
MELNDVPNMTSSGVNEANISAIVLEAQLRIQPFREFFAIDVILLGLKVIQTILKKQNQFCIVTAPEKEPKPLAIVRLKAGSWVPPKVMNSLWLY